MRFVCLIALLVSGVSGEMSGCVVDSDGSRTCHGALASGDVTSLLQMHTRQQDAEEHHDKLVARTATVTRRCLNQDAVDHVDPDCVMSDWTDWGSCTKTCGSGIRSRSRTVTSGPADGGKCCSEEEQTCNSKPCTVDCKMGDWSTWTTCSGPCGTSSRSREVLETPDALGLCDCTKEAKACNTDDCGGTLKPQDLTTPAPTGIEVCGIVRDAADYKNVIDKATVMIGSQTTESNSSGKFCAEVPQGEHTLTSTKQPDWLDTKQPLTVAESRVDVTVDMSKKLPPKDWRIILSWPKTPLDLDARTQFGDFANLQWKGPCAVFYNETGPKTCPQNGIQGQVDQDHCYFSTAYPGASWSTPGKPCGASASEESKPETTTLKGVDPSTCKNDCKIGFHVSNFVGSSIAYWKTGGKLKDGVPKEDTGTLVDSKATVRVIHGEEQKAFFEISKKQGFIQYSKEVYDQNGWSGYDQGREEWWVFYIDVKTSKVEECKDAKCFSSA